MQANRQFSKSLVNHFKGLLVQVFKLGGSSQLFISDIAQGLQSSPEESIADVKDPLLIITHYLFCQLQTLKEAHAKPEDGSKIIHTFFRNLSVPVHPTVQVQFEEIARRIIHPRVDDANLVGNMWKDSTQTYTCYCGVDDALALNQAFGEELCFKCGRKCHIKCFWGRDKTDKHFECPVCYMRNCQPQNPVDQVLFLGFLEYEAKEDVEYRVKFQFNMSNLNTSNVSIRCVRLNQANRYEMTFPNHCKMSLSGKMLKEFDPLPSTSPLKRRNDQEVDINKHLLGYLNIIYIRQKHPKLQHNPNLQEHHLLMVASTKPIAISKQIQANFAKETLQAEKCKALLQESFKQTINQCQIQKITVSLQCQYFGTQITRPARSKHCSHYQPFDLTNFVRVSMSSTSNCVQKWKCPICKKRAYDLFLDDYLESLIKARDNLRQITFSKDAEPIFVEKQNQPDEDSQENLKDSEANNKDDKGCPKEIQVINLSEEANQNEDNQLQLPNALKPPKPENLQNLHKNEKMPVQTLKQVEIVISLDDSDSMEEEGFQRSMKRTFQERTDLQQRDQVQELRKIRVPPEPVLNKILLQKQIGTALQKQLESTLSKRLEPATNKQITATSYKQITTVQDKQQTALDRVRSSEKPQAESARKLESQKCKSRTKPTQTLPPKHLMKSKESSVGFGRVDELKQVNSSESKRLIQSSAAQQKGSLILDIDNWDEKRKQMQKELLTQQKILFEQAKKVLHKEPFTRTDQITFNLICRQLHHLRIS